MQNGRNPLSGLDTYKGCSACLGVHSAHYFFCVTRKIEPRAKELLLRDALKRELTTIWRARQVAQVHAARALPPHACTRAARRARALSLTPEPSFF